MSSLNKVEAKAFQDPNSGLIYEIYPIDDGKKVMFNLDGSPFKFKSFILVTKRLENTIQEIFLHIPFLSGEELVKIGAQVQLNQPAEQIAEMGELTVRLDLKKEPIEKFLNPKFSSVNDLKAFLDIKDDIGGSVILDFYYYNLTSIENPFEKFFTPAAAIE